MNKITAGSVLILSMILVFFWTQAALADVYQYQDENGNWVFTDSPPAEESGKAVKMDGMISGQDGLRNLKKELYKQYPPKNEVDSAAIATVTVVSPVGTGSGFFVSNNGYLITNRHVIRGDKARAEATDDAIEYIDKRIQAAEEEFKLREKQIERGKEELDEMKSAIRKWSGRPSQRAILEKQYQRRLEYYEMMKKDLENRKALFDRGKKNYNTGKSDYAGRQAVAGLNRNFKIKLKNKEVLYAYLVRASNTYDLALLKIDGCITPFIKPANRSQVSQQQKVWAIGSPLNLADTMKNGTVSGFTKGYIQTNAQIYPGNSGGPLVNENGQVIGINTLKELTRHFEGIGLAIPIDKALEEFSSELQ